MKTFNVKVLYIYKFLGQCLPIYAFYTLLFMERGMSVTDIAVLIALWSIFTIVFEVPSGVMADRWNRRNMLVIASVLQGLCFTIWFYSHTFLMFAIGFIFWAVAGAFTSGTEEGLIYDNLKSDGREEDFAKVYGRARFYANIGTLAGIISAGILSVFCSIESITLLSAAICFLDVIVIFQMREKNYYSERMDNESMGLFNTFKEAFTFVKGSRDVLVSVLFLILFASLGDYLDEFDALIIHDFQQSNLWVSVILTVRFAFVALGDILAPIVQKKITSVRQIYLFDGVGCVFLLVFTILWNKYALLFFGLGLMVMAVTEILLVDALQNEIKEEGRATIMSFYGVGQNIIMICFSLVYALLARMVTLQQVYTILSLYSIAGGLSFCLFLKLVKSRR